MRRLLIALGVVVCLVLVLTGGLAVFFAGEISVVSHKPRYDTLVDRVDATTVTLKRTHNDALPGTYAIKWPGGRSVVDDIVAMDSFTVTRHLANGPTSVAVGTKVHWDENVFAGDPMSGRGLTFQNVNVDTSLGAMPAWYVPSTSSTWVIVVHGHNASRETALRVLPAIHDAGYPSLTVTYRNDEGAPASRDGRNHLGASEWHDVDSAITYARAHGAKDVVLYGGSMGGAVVAETVRHSAQADAVRAVVWDCPVLDWRATLDAQGATHHLPLFESRAAEQLFAWRNGFSFDDFDQVAHAADFHVPILLFYGTEDIYVPTAPDLAFAKKRPDIVKLVANKGASHTAGWNVDSHAYEAELTAFLKAEAP